METNSKKNNMVTKNIFEEADVKSEIITGKLLDCIMNSVIGTQSTSREITNERRMSTNGLQKVLMENWFQTSNFSMYAREGDDLVLYLGGRENNPLYDNPFHSVNYSLNLGVYTPTPEQIEKVHESVISGETFKAKFKDIANSGNPSSGIIIDTNSFPSLTKTQRDFAEKVYGLGEEFEENMEFLRDNGISHVSIKYYLCEEFTAKNLRYNNSAIAFFTDMSGTFPNSSSSQIGFNCHMSVLRDAQYRIRAMRSF